MILFPNKMIPLSICLVTVLVNIGGCRDPRASTRKTLDPFVAAMREVEDPAERRYIDASRPILEAIAKRKYEQFYQYISPQGLKRVEQDQFGPGDSDESNSGSRPSLTNLTIDKFVAHMEEMERRLGIPIEIGGLYVASLDAEELAGKSDRFTTLITIGAMPADIPAEIRRAAVHAQFYTRLPDDNARELATELGISVEQVQSRRLPADAEIDDEDWTYFNLKLVFIEENGELRIGYFEFNPPSILD